MLIYYKKHFLQSRKQLTVSCILDRRLIIERDIPADIGDACNCSQIKKLVERDLESNGMYSMFDEDFAEIRIWAYDTEDSGQEIMMGGGIKLQCDPLTASRLDLERNHFIFYKNNYYNMVLNINPKLFEDRFESRFFCIRMEFDRQGLT